MDKYQLVFNQVGGKISIDAKYPPEHYLQLIKETGICWAGIINACGGLLQIAQWPVLDLQGQTNFTGYIDWLKPKDLSAHVMRGIDCHSRPFIAFRYVVRYSGWEEIHVETLFQRYTNITNEWTNGGGREIAIYQPRLNSMLPVISERLLRLIQHKPVGTVHFSESLSEYVEAEPRVLEDGRSIIELV